MSRLKWMLGLACLACCTVPLLAIAGGVLGLSAAGAVALSANLTQLLLCLLPVGVLLLCYAGYQWYRRRNRCCISPVADCTATSCGTVGRGEKAVGGEAS